MARLILGIGGAVGGSMIGIPPQIGGMIGASIGGLIDNKLFPDQNAGPGMGSPLQVSSYGKPLPKCYGPENRIAGNVIWHSNRIKNSAPGLTAIDFISPLALAKDLLAPPPTSYRIHVAIALCEGARSPSDLRRAIKGIRKIWANGKLIYDADAPPQSGVSSPSDDQGLLYDILIGEVALLFDQQHGVTHSVFGSMVVYAGDFGQPPDPTIEAFEGVGNATAYRGTAYLVLNSLQLADFGNRIPNIECLVVADEEVSVAEVADDIATACGVPFVSTIAIADQDVRGYTIAASASGVGALQPLALGYDFDVAEVSGDLRFVKRNATPVAVIPLDDMAAYAGTDTRPGALSVDSLSSITLPREAAIGFIDPDRDWQPNTAVSRRQVGNAQNNLATTLPLVLDVADAGAIADRALWEAWTSRQKITGTLDDRWIYLEPGRCYLVDTPAGLEPIRITRRTRGANGIIQFEALRDRAEVYQSTVAGVGGSATDNPLDIPGPTELILLDIPILLDADDNGGFYFAVVGSGSWRGASMLRADSEMGDYIEFSQMGSEAVVGGVDGTLADGATDGFDDLSVLTVILRRSDMVLASASDAALENGANACFVGDPNSTVNGEVLQFGTATLIAPGVYQLTHWKRGRKGTEFATGLHGPGEIFVQLQVGVEKRADFGVGDIGEERFYKAVSIFTNEQDADAIIFTNTGVGLRPYSPIDLDVNGATGDDLLLSWTRRSRLESGALGEFDERYTLRIMDAAGAVIVREEEITEPDFTYTLADQTADFGGAVSDLRWRVAQVSATYGNGIFEEFNGPVPTVTGT